jgi:hypothetical protein
VVSVFEPVRFLLPVCRLSWFLYTFFSATIEGRNLIFGHKLHIGTPYRGKRFWTHQISTSCLTTLLIFIHIEHIHCMFISLSVLTCINFLQCSRVAYLEPSDSYFLFADLVGFYTHWTYMHIFRHIFLSNYWWQRSDIWSQASYTNVGTPYRGKRFWTHQIPSSCLPTLLIFIHIYTHIHFVYAHF